MATKRRRKYLHRRGPLVYLLVYSVAIDANTLVERATPAACGPAEFWNCMGNTANVMLSGFGVLILVLAVWITIGIVALFLRQPSVLAGIFLAYVIGIAIFAGSAAFSARYELQIDFDTWEEADEHKLQYPKSTAIGYAQAVSAVGFLGSVVDSPLLIIFSIVERRENSRPSVQMLEAFANPTDQQAMYADGK